MVLENHHRTIAGTGAAIDCNASQRILWMQRPAAPPLFREHLMIVETHKDTEEKPDTERNVSQRRLLDRAATGAIDDL